MAIRRAGSSLRPPGLPTARSCRLHLAEMATQIDDTLPAEPGAQVVVVHDESTGRVRAVAVGNEMGPRRVGATGAIAADALAPAAAAGVVAVIGTGTHAYTQVWALAAVRALRDARVYSRTGRAPTRKLMQRPSEVGSCFISRTVVIERARTTAVPSCKTPGDLSPEPGAPYPAQV
jgi:hypothetical protein